MMKQAFCNNEEQDEMPQSAVFHQFTLFTKTKTEVHLNFETCKQKRF